MKIFTHIMAMALFGLATGAMAQTTSTSDAPADGSFIRIKARSAGLEASKVEKTPYLVAEPATNNTKRLKFEEQTEPQANSIFLYKNNMLIGYSNGKKITNAGENQCGFTGNQVVNGYLFTFQKSTYGGSEGNYFNVLFKNGSTGGNAALFTHTTDNGATFYNDKISSNWSNFMSCDYTIESVTELPVTVTEAGWASLHVPATLSIPADVEAYTMSVDETNSVLNLNKLTGTIPGGTPVVIKASAGTHNFPIVTDETTTTAAATDSHVQGTTDFINKPQTGTVLTLGNTNNVPGFYRYTGTTIPGFKAYIILSASSSVRSLSFNDNTTGIKGVTTGGTTSEATCYDLSGRRVEHPTSGIYVVAGKKVIIK